MSLIVLKFFHYLAIIFAGGVLVGGGLIQSVFAHSNQLPDKNIGKVDNFFSLSPIVMYLPIKLQDTILKKLIKRASVITIIESLTKLS